MLYALKQGKTEQKILEMAAKQGMPIPPSIENAPELLPGLEIYYHAFLNLTTDRTFGMAEGPIPWSAMDRYARRHGIEGFDFDRFVVIMRIMDTAYSDYQESRRNKAESKAAIGKGQKSG